MKVSQQRLYPTDVTNAPWEVLPPRFPPAKATGRPRELAMRLLINAIVDVVGGGIQGRRRPRESPTWQRVYDYFQPWREDGTWQRRPDTRRAPERERRGRHQPPTAGCLDSQSVKASAGVGERGSDAGKQVNGRQRHRRVDPLGVVLAGVVTAAAVPDRDGARWLRRRLGGACKQRRLIGGDGNYRGPRRDWVAKRFRWLRRPGLRADDQKGCSVLPRRWVVDRTCGWLVGNRRLRKDDEGLPARRAAMLDIAMTRLRRRRLAA